MTRSFSGGAAALLLVAGVAAGTLVSNMALPAARAHQDAGAASPAPEAAASRIATLNVFSIIEKVIQGDRYLPARDAHNKQQKDKLDAMVADLQGLQQRLQAAAADPANTETQTMMQEFETKRQEFQQAQFTAQNEVEKFNTAQLLEVYGLVAAAADKVAAAKGYTHVIVSKDPKADMDSENLSNALQEILARPMLRSPAADDITPLVATELGVS